MTTAVPRRRLGLPIALAAVLVIGILAAAGVAGWAVYNPAEKSEQWPDKQTAAATQAARHCVTASLTLGPDTVDASIQKVLDCSTGTFRQHFEDRQEELRRWIRDNQMEQSVRNLHTAVSTVEPDKVGILVSVDTVLRPQSAGGDTHQQLVVEMVRVKGRWLMTTPQVSG